MSPSIDLESIHVPFVVMIFNKLYLRKQLQHKRVEVLRLCIIGTY